MITLQNDNTTVFDTQGFGSLTDSIKCTVTEELNGTFELTLEYPIAGIHYIDIQLRRLIYCKPNPYSEPQPFRIYSISKPINRIVTINAAHISYDLSDFPVNPFKGTSPKDTMSRLKNNATIAHNFSFNSTVTTEGEVNVEEPRSTRSVLGNNILSAYGGEYEFDMFMVYHKTKRGMDRGVSIRYGKNLTDINQEENISEMYTGIYPYWIGYEYNEETGEQGKKVMVTLKDKIVNVDGKFNFTKILPLDLSDTSQDPPTTDKLLELAKKYIKEKDLGVPKISIDVSFVQLSKSLEYEQYSILEQVSIGDDLDVEFMEAQINATARCVKTVYNAVTDKYDSITLGQGRSNLASSISDSNANISDKVEQQKQFFDAEVGKIKIDLAVIDTALIDKADIKYLEANFAHITNGIIDNATIGDATITTAKIKDASIITAKIQDAAITSAKIEDASITVAKIENAFIDNLVAQQGKFESAHIGELNANNIAANTITAGSGIIAEGAIGSAEISTLDAGKISAGTIDTTKVEIAGADGHLKLSGNRMQVFDGLGAQAKERVSIGDVDGDGSLFGLRVRGADGETILIDENGVKSEGITDGSITNDKISGDANIDGAKININSVVTKINEDGTEVIKGTKIEVDGTNLTAKLSTITNQQTEDGELISQNKASIAANEKNIKLKVDEQIYQTDKEGINTSLEKHTSDISLMKGQLALKVEQSDIENAVSEFEGLIDTKVDTAKGEIKVTTDAITQNVTKLTNTVEHKADGSTVEALTTKVGSLETSVNGIVGTVSNLETTTEKLAGDVDEAVKEVSTMKSEVAILDINLKGITQKVSDVETTTETLTTTVGDIESDMIEVIAKVETTNSKVAEIVTDLSSITQRVSTVETTTETINDNVEQQEIRLSSAESKIVDSAIISTVTNSEQYKQDFKNGDIYARGTYFNNPANRLIKIKGVPVLDNGTRGLSIYVVAKHNLQMVYHKDYDTYGDDAQLVNFINDMDYINNEWDRNYKDTIIIITSCDAATYNEHVKHQLNRAGGMFNLDEETEARSSYALIGAPLLGRGKGIQLFYSGASAPYSEVSAKLIDGVLVGNSGNGNEIISQTQSKITQLSDSITQKIDSTDGRVTEVTTNLNGFKTSVSLSGGENLLKNSRFSKGTDYYHEHSYDFNGSDAWTRVDTPSSQWCLDGRNTLVVHAHNATTGQYGLYQNMILKKNCTYTISGYGAAHRGKYYAYVQRNGGDWHCPGGVMGSAHGGKTDDTWDKWSFTFTTDSALNDYNVHFKIIEAGSDAYAWFTDIMVSEGSVRKKWEAHSSEMYTGIMSFDGDELKVSHTQSATYSALNAEGLKIYSNSGREIASFGESNKAIIGELEADVVNAGNVMPQLRDKGKLELWVRANATGSGSGLDANNYADSAITALTNLFYKYGINWDSRGGMMLTNTDIFLHYGYPQPISENLYIRDFLGGGKLVFDLYSDVVLTGAWEFRNCSRVEILGMRTDTNTNNGALFKKRGTQNGLSLYNCKYVLVKGCRFNNPDSNYSGISCADGTHARVRECDFYGFNQAIYANLNSMVSAYNNNGHGHGNWSYYALDGGIMTYAGLRPSGTVKSNSSGSAWLAADQSSSTKNSLQVSQPPPTNQTLTQSFKPVSYKSVRSYNSESGNLKQGCWVTSKGNFTGYIEFGSKIKDWLSDSSGGLSGTIYLSRMNDGHGQFRGVPVNINGNNVGTLNLGEGKWFNIPASVLNELKSGSRTNITTTGSGQSEYIKYNTNVTVKITATKPV